MRELLRKHLTEPIRRSGRAYLHAVQRHWVPLALAVLAIVGSTQIVYAFSLPYWVWLTIAFVALAWAQFLAFNDLSLERDELADEVRIGHEGRRALEARNTDLRERVRHRDLIAVWAQELRRAETLYHRTTAHPVHPFTDTDLRDVVEGLNETVRLYLMPIDPDTAQRFLDVSLEQETPLSASVVKRAILEDFITDPAYFDHHHQRPPSFGLPPPHSDAPHS